MPHGVSVEFHGDEQTISRLLMACQLSAFIHAFCTAYIFPFSFFRSRIH